MGVNVLNQSHMPIIYLYTVVDKYYIAVESVHLSTNMSVFLLYYGFSIMLLLGSEKAV